MLGCFFCTRRNDVSDQDYSIPLCITCRHLDHFQILLLQNLAFIHGALTEIQEALDPRSRRFPVVPDVLEDLGDAD